MILVCDGDWASVPMTEQYALEQARALLPESSRVIYLAVPWSKIYDNQRLADIKEQLKDKRCVVSVCASPSLSSYVSLMSDLRITHLFWPYCRKSVDENPDIPKRMKLMPFPLYPESEPVEDEVANLWQSLHFGKTVDSLPSALQLPGITGLWKAMLNPEKDNNAARQLSLMYGIDSGCFIHDVAKLLVNASSSKHDEIRGCTLSTWEQNGQQVLDYANPEQRNLFLNSLIEALFITPGQLRQRLEQDMYLRLYFWNCCRLASPTLLNRLVRLQGIRGGLLPGFPKKLAKVDIASGR
tara:strand:+ start:226 stop:1116 length:891 start_codon:yes stop_codon:yes gene_type:complete